MNTLATYHRGYYALLAGAALRILRDQPLTYVGVFRPPLGGRAVQDG